MIRSITRILTTIALLTYPRGFREEFGEDYLSEALGRLDRETRRRGAFRGSLTTARILILDWFGSVPGVWRSRRLYLWTMRREAMKGNGATTMQDIAGWAGDVGMAFRILSRRRATSLAVILILGLGLGVNLAIFGMLDRVVLNPYPFEGGDRVAILALSNRAEGGTYTPRQEQVDLWRDGARAVEQIEVYQPSQQRWHRPEGATLLESAAVSWGMALFTGLRPVVGRTFVESDVSPDAPPVVMLDESLWRTEFGADPDVVGTRLRLGETSVEVIGVWPSDIRPRLNASPAVWTLLQPGDEVSPSRFAMVLARLGEGETPASVEADLRRLGEPDMPRAAPGELTVLSATGLTSETLIQSLWILFWGSLAVGAVAALNAANLMLGRAISRTGELGVRLALGGSRLRLTGSFVWEALLLSLGGLIVAGGAATAGAALFYRSLPAEVTGLGTHLVLSPRTLGWAVGLAAAVTAVCALVPALQLSSPAVHSMMQSASTARGSRRGSRRLRSGLIGLQVATAVLVATGAGLAFRSHALLSGIDTGIPMRETVSFGVSLVGSRYETDVERAATMSDLIARFEAIPQVRGVTSSGNPFFFGSTNQGVPLPQGWTGPPPLEGEFHGTFPTLVNFFEVMEIPVRGDVLPFVPGTAPNVLVNEAYVRRFGDVLGQRIMLPGDTLGFRVTGVTRDLRITSLTERADQIQIFFPQEDFESGYARVVLRTADPDAALGTARTILREVDPELVMLSPALGRDLLRDQTGRERFAARLLIVLGSLTLLLSAGGVFSVADLDVRERTREIGIRLALGAKTPDLVGYVTRSGMIPVVGGVVIGVLASLGIASRLAGFLHEVSPRDPVSLFFAAGLLILAGLAGSVVPAIRASKVEPTDALRSE